ncbi:ABC transporter ATP-binding protein [Candidatus Bathyarchaeota archaeon]|nr:ABC transporter ATP-binding protein [Candidatus Bathyarchaeota archaeon]
MSKSLSAIEVVGLRKVYSVGSVRVPALRGVTFTVEKGKFVSIVGPSGCGKSTLLNMIGALDRPTQGKVVVDGVDITRLNDRRLARFRNSKIGFIFQTYNLINRTTVLRNVELPAIVKGIPSRIRRLKALKLLKLVGLEEKADRKPTEMSGGEQQRVAIARALINDPAIVLADEPTGNLDSKTGEEIISLLGRINRENGATIIMVTHNLELANRTNRMIRLRDGLIEKVIELS